MEFLFFFSFTGVVIVSLILWFDKKQTIKINKVLKETRGVLPLFMIKSTELKISIIKNVLRYDDVPQNIGGKASLTDSFNFQSESKRLSKIQDFKLLSSKYNNGLISIEAYNLKLDELLDQAQNKSGAFEIAC